MKRGGIFYGWYIVAAGLLLMTLNGGAVIYGFTAFIKPIAAAFGWSYAQISLAASLRGVETGVMNPFLGVAVDRWPAKRLVLFGTVVAGLGFLCMSQLTNLAMFYIGSLILAFGTSLATQMVPPTLVARWFRKDIGKASGILAMGHGVGGAMLPLLVLLIDTFGWRFALMALAIVFWALGIPLAFVLRDRPEDLGLQPDGKSVEDTYMTQGVATQESSPGVAEALRMPVFWAIGIASMFQVSIMAAGTIHMMPYLASLGIERSRAGIVAMLVPLVSLGVRIPYGLLADVIRKNYVMALVIALLGVGMMIFAFVDGSVFGLVLLGAIILGLGIGGLMTLRTPLMREYFGTRNFATILGLNSVFTTAGMVVAPPLVGWYYDAGGVFGPAWLILGVLAMVGTVIMLALPPARG